MSLSIFTKFAAIFGIIITALGLWTSVTQNEGGFDPFDTITEFFQSVLCTVATIVIKLIWLILNLVLQLIGLIFPDADFELAEPQFSC